MAEKAKYNFFENFNWLLFEKILRVVVGLFIGLWVARYLGPDNFGILSYSLTIITIFSVFVSFGIDNVIIKELVEDKSSKYSILKTSYFIKIVSSLIALISIIFHLAFRVLNSEYFWVILVASSSILFKPFTIPDLFFQSNLTNKKSAISNSLAILISALFKIFLIYNNLPVIWFAFAIAIEMFFYSIFLHFYLERAFLYSTIKAPLSFKYIFKILQASWPLLISGVVVLLFLRVDQLMIESILGKEQVGLYASATRLSESWYLIPTIATTILYPTIISIKSDKSRYGNTIKSLYNKLIWLSAAVALFVSYFSDAIMNIAFGAEYVSASSVLNVHIWMGILVSIQLVSSKWLLAENMNKFIFYRGMVGLILNILLNLYLIPIHGITGAAYASLATMFFSVIIMDLAMKKTREHLKLKLSSIFSFVR